MAPHPLKEQGVVEHEVAHPHRLAIVQPAVRLERLAFHAIFAAILLQLRDPEAVRLLRTLDRHTQLRRQYPRLPAMIDMAVGDQDLLNLHALLLRRGVDQLPGHGLQPAGRIALARIGQGQPRLLQQLQRHVQAQRAGLGLWGRGGGVQELKSVPAYIAV